MEGITSLLDMVGDRKTLIIANGTCRLYQLHELNERIFIYNLAGSALQASDPLEKGKIHFYIAYKKCSQVIFVGSIEQIVMEGILNGDAQLALTAGITFNTEVLLRHKAHAILPTPLRDRVLSELLVVGQCNMLMEYYCMQPPIADRSVSIRGVISENPYERYKTIFYNGVVYNDLISMN